MKKSVIVNGQKKQVEVSIVLSRELKREVTPPKRPKDTEMFYLRELKIYSIEGKSVDVLYEDVQLNGNINRKWQLNGIWYNSEKKFIEAFLNN
jgi:hypothetical protein